MSKRLSTLFLLALALAAGPAWAGDRDYGYRWYGDPEHNIRLRLGGFEPRGDSEYWDDKQRDFTGDPQDLEDVSFGLDYRVDLTPHVGLMFSGTLFEGELDQEYLDFEDDRGNAIGHTTSLELASATAGLVFHFTGPEAAIRPYVGAGGGLYAWRLEEDGEFIDFTPPPPVIFEGLLEAEGNAFGYYLLAGLDVPVGRNWSFFAEGRWQRVEDELGDDFEDFGDLDLSGRDLSAGIAWRF